MYKKKSYRDILSSILEERQKINSKYSLRAFSRSLDFDSARLSRVLNGKQGLSLTAANTLAKKIGFSESETEIFTLMVLSSDARSKKVRTESKFKLLSLRKTSGWSQKDLKVKDYEILREWYNIAILEMVELDRFINDEKWIADELDITPLLVRKSLSKLLKIGVLKEKHGKLFKTQKILKIDPGIAHDFMKSFYEQLLQKAKESIYMQNLRERHLTSVTICLDKQDVEVLAEEINKFRSKFNELAESLAKNKKKKHHVYCLTTQFFKLDKGEKR